MLLYKEQENDPATSWWKPSWYAKQRNKTSAQALLRARSAEHMNREVVDVPWSTFPTR